MLAAVLVVSACGSSSPSAIPEMPESVPLGATPEPRVLELMVWPNVAPPDWARTPDEAAAAFAQHVALGDRAAEPRPAVQGGTTAIAELPRLGEDGAPFGLATTINMQEVTLDDGTTAWVVASAQSEDIVVDFPAIGELLAGGTFVRGHGQGFEGTIAFRIEDRDGMLGTALAQGGAMGENIPFETHVLFDQRPASGDWAIVIGYTTSAADGSLSALTMVPTRLVDKS